MPFYHQYATNEKTDRVVWEVEAGYADFEDQDNVLTINDAKDGTILLKKVYYNGNLTTTPYRLNVTGDCEMERYTVEGSVLGDQKRWDYGMIYLFDINKDKAVDSVQFEKGIYLFRNVLAGNYTLYAVPYTDHTLKEKTSVYSPTYYVKKLTKEEANTFEVTANTFGVDLQLKATDEIIASINDANDLKISTYPNPFTDELIFASDIDNANLRIYSTQGNTIYSGPLESSLKINTSNWDKGIYLIEIETPTGIKNYKVVK